MLAKWERTLGVRARVTQSPRSWQTTGLCRMAPWAELPCSVGRAGIHSCRQAWNRFSYWSLTSWRRNDPILTSLSPSDRSYPAAPRSWLAARRERAVQRRHPGHDHRRSEGGRRRRRRHGDQHPERRDPRVGHDERRRVSRAEPRPRRLSRRGRQAGIPQRAARVGDGRHQRNGASRLHARGLRRPGERHGHDQRAARRNRAGPRVRAGRSPAAAGDAAQRQEPVQPDRAPAGRHRQGRLGVDQRRRRRRRLLRRRIRAAHQCQRAARRSQQLHRRPDEHQRRRARRHHQPDAEHGIGRGSPRRLQQLLGR